MSNAKPWNPIVQLPIYGTTDVVTVKLAVTIDWDQIAWALARQARRNKSKRTTMLDKAIKAKIID